MLHGVGAERPPALGEPLRRTRVAGNAKVLQAAPDAEVRRLERVAVAQRAHRDIRRRPRPDSRKIEHLDGVRRKVEALAGLFAKRVRTGEAIGRLRIPRIGLDVVAVQGTDTASLQKGPGHYPETPFPGQRGTSAFAGHRTTYLAPFRHLDELQRGDEIEVEMPYANFDIIHRVGYERLVLTACHPLYSAAQRIAAFAKLTEVSFFAIGDRKWYDP